MDEEMFEAYSQWANDNFIWGKGLGNWCRAYAKEEWKKPPMFKYEFNEELNDHPLCTFGYGRKD